jgi:hypothetical protein
VKSQSGFVKLVVIFCNNEDKGEHFMSTRKTIGGALGAIIVLIVAQILAQLVASLFVLVKIPEGICNIIAGIIYVFLRVRNARKALALSLAICFK